jgi:four helix bundle protein
MGDCGFIDDGHIRDSYDRQAGWKAQRFALAFASYGSMTPDELKARTQKLSFDKATRNLPTDTVTREIVRQLVRSGSSVGANYRSGCRARSDKEFIAKLGMVEDEADETMFWLELLVFVARNRKLRRKPGRNHQSTITNESKIPNPQSK